ncbi:OPT oligopeptide transporter protein-domain-containing protein [Lipomyces doorenjongii]|uniref:OPT oligopeptide transporter protein-domain-containing protein n=1 Tax=Lipomyces doorenjongii TaxID=383834 RepID=UPI0034CD2045
MLEQLSSHSSEASVSENEKKTVVPEVVEITSEMRNNLLERLNEKSSRDKLNATRRDIDFIMDKFVTMSEEQALNILNKAIDYHDDDFNFPVTTYGQNKASCSRPGRATIHWSVTDPYDEDVPVETIRVYFLAILWTFIGAGIRQFFSRLLEQLPDWGFTFRGKRHSINPGPWTFKEQMLTTVMLNVAVGGAYVSLYSIIVQKLPMFYGNTWATPGYQFLLIFSTQFLGFGFAGVLRRWVIYPVKAVWPSVLPSIALSRALLKPDKRENIHGWTISRYWFFLTCFGLRPKKYLPKYFRFVNPVLIIGGMSAWSPYNLSYHTPGLYLSIIFMYFIRRRYLGWWEKYNYVLSSAMDAALLSLRLLSSSQ